jgi:hypothetical protein
MRCDEEQYEEILKFAEELKKRQIPIVYETYSSYFLEEVYNLADIRIVYKINDMNDILEYIKKDHEEPDYFEGRDDANPTDISDAYNERYGDDDEIIEYNYNVSPEIDYDNVYGQTVDPYDDDVSGFKKKDTKKHIEKYHTWRIMHNGFRFEKMPWELKKRILRDATESKNKIPERGGSPITKVYKDFNRKTEAAHYAISKLEEIDPRIDYLMVTGGYAKHCLPEFLEVLRNTKKNIRLFSKYIIVSMGITQETLYQNCPPGFIQRSGTEKIMRHKYQHYLDNL